MKSSAFRKFKNETGQANHFLITIMVGLDAIEDGATKRDTFHTVWNPKDTQASVQRSRHYAIKSALAWTVDTFDMYLRLCNRAPRLYNEIDSKEIAKTKHSVYKKFSYMISKHSELHVSQYAYVDLLIAWRNNTTHYDAENQLLPTSMEYFKTISADDIVVNTYHLDVNKMLERFQCGKYPTFKELTTLISMTIHFVESIDVMLLTKIEQYSFLESELHQILQMNNEAESVFCFKNTTSLKRQKKLKQLFSTYGICDDFYNKDGERFLQEVSMLRADKFKSIAKSHLDGSDCQD